MAEATILQTTLKQFGELRHSDFESHPVWIACHSVDDQEPWYADTDEETFRPWTGVLPASQREGMLLALASIQTADGQSFNGFVTPSLEPGDLGANQLQMFVGQGSFGFWGGLFGVPEAERRRFYDAIGKHSAQVFPLRFSAQEGLVTGFADGRIEGFYRLGQAIEH